MMQMRNPELKHYACVRMVLFASCVSLGLFACIAHAGELFKCRSRSGQILYSDIACDKSGAVLIGTIERPPERAADAQRSSAAPERARAKKSAKDPQARRLREEELKPILESASSTLEQKAAAQEE